MRKFLLTATTLLAVPLLWASAANATLISIGLQEAGVNGGAVTTIATDGGTGDTGVAAVAYGSFTINNISALGAPFLTQPQFDTNSINLASSSGGTLTVFITEQGLSLPTGISTFLSSFTANLLNGAVTSVQESTLISTANALYSGTTLASAVLTSIGITIDTDATPALASPYSETAVYVVTTTGTANVNDTINIASVPEPATMAIVGTGLFGIGVIRRRRRL
jgi:hypothetical protein